MIGQTISHYKILEKLGGGGMGVVYKAEDTRLKRIVALKFLPPELTRDEEAKQRFIHEAQAASALDHNNICNIHEIGETDDGQMFIAMACYEGETLKQKIERGPLKIEEATDLAIQIAQGLAEAHAHGIVHRDVKPANILVTKNSVAKIVDFGLAKLSGRTKLTKTGSTLGTVAYMSPEQLQDSNVDARADIFSFGVVLYEMLTGKTPFRGEHEAALMYSIINEEPEPLQQYIPGVSSELIHIVSRALEKSPADRYKTMDDLLIDLRRLRRETSKVSMPAFRGIREARLRWKPAALIVTCVAIGIALLVVFIVPSSNVLPEWNPGAITRPMQLPIAEVQYPRLSGDGKWIAFGGADVNGKWDVYFMNAAAGDVRRVSHDSSDRVVVGDISHDGAWVAYWRQFRKSGNVYGVGEIAIVPSMGGVGKTLCRGGGPRWSADNQRIFYLSNPGSPTESGKYEVWSIKKDGTNNRREFVDPGIQGLTQSFSLSPDGRSLTWIKSFPDFLTEIIVHDFETSNDKQITFDKAQMDEVTWTTNNFLIYSSNRGGSFDLWMCPADGGQSVQLTRSTAAELRAQLSDDGKRLLYFEWQNTGNIRIANLESGEVTPITSDDLNREGLSISPDGGMLAFVPTDAYGAALHYGIRVTDRRNEKSWDLVKEERTGNLTAWSPDGKWIAYVRAPRTADEVAQICVISPENSTTPKVIGEGGGPQPWGSYSAEDLKWVDNDTLRWFHGMKTWISSVNNPNPRQLYDDSTQAYLSRDQRYVLFRDYRRGHEGWWIDSAPSSVKSVSGRFKKILGDVDANVAPNGAFMLCRTKAGGLQKIMLPEGRIQRLPYDLNISQYQGAIIAENGKEVAYIEWVFTGKLALVENPFVWK